MVGVRLEMVWEMRPVKHRHNIEPSIVLRARADNPLVVSLNQIKFFGVKVSTALVLFLPDLVRVAIRNKVELNDEILAFSWLNNFSKIFMNVPHRLFIVGVAKVRSVRAKDLAILVHSFLARVFLLNDLPSLHLFLLTRHVTILITVLLIFKYFEKLSVILLIRHLGLSL